MISIQNSSMSLPFAMFPYTGRRHQLCRVPYTRGTTQPMLRHATGINANRARLQLRKQCIQLGTAQLAAKTILTSWATSLVQKILFAISRPTIATRCKDFIQRWMENQVGMQERWRTSPMHQVRTRSEETLRARRGRQLRNWPTDLFDLTGSDKASPLGGYADRLCENSGR